MQNWSDCVLRMATVAWHSKKQVSIESSSLVGSELSAMKTIVEMIEGLCCKLHMMGIPLDGRTFVKADNMSAIHNCSNPASQLKKKSNSISHHCVRERCTVGVCGITCIRTQDNLADMHVHQVPAWGSVKAAC